MSGEQPWRGPGPWHGRGPWRFPWVRAGWPVLSSVVIAVIQVAGSGAAARHQVPPRHALDAFGYLLLLAGPALLVLRRRRPVVAVAGTGVVLLVYLAAGYPYGPVFASFAVAYCVAVRLGHRRAAWATLGGVYLGHLLLTFAMPAGWLPGTGHGGWWQELGVTALALLLAAVAELVRFRFEQIVARRAAEEAAVRRRADEERLRMARELHDILAHSISLIHVQAGVALELIDDQPEQARSALVTIKAASKEALGEVRQVLGTLRGPGAAAPRRPAPGLDRLPELVEQAAHAGLTVTVRSSGTARALPAGAGLAAFRIVQEALTNVIRHSAARRAEVLLDWTVPEGLTVRIDDPGPAAQPEPAEPPGGGNGLAGMRERAEALGGTLAAGPHQGGFRVLAWLPAGRTADGWRRDEADR
ncbi:signal transduction histidine kinase [Kitasatospora sp. GP30]|uniref:sensor histidine kinase n=1 Tax=Kitasatospora sp. GP30 TaxID=3035084 RepID=UPI000C70CDA3|nr:sensor histidine kinase [Kitasatospora sp. GP30]MDH6143855.1 signal transduction histidine kinase [Kitasatospora sp. GP30]